ncbi:MAG: pseudouridine synthase [Legionellales bacterium]|nr:pseudouridine synthase [Legionellales bacterium]
MSEKIQKLLANLGIASRRQIEEMIKQGRIFVNRELAHVGQRVNFHDHITVDNRQIDLSPPASTRVLIYHKPIGEICTRNDPENRPTIFERLPKLTTGRWVSVGRLDINTLGLLLLTNNGELAEKLMHPRYQIEREYAVRVLGEVSNEQLSQLQQGIRLDDGVAQFDEILDKGGKGANHWYYVILREGRNREVRRLWESIGATVSRLIRIRYGNIVLPRDLKPGQYRELTQHEIQRYLP